MAFHSAKLMRGIVLKGFGNFRTRTVQDPQRLYTALQDISSMMHMPHFKTIAGMKFKPEDIDKALQYSPENGAGKAVLYPMG